MMLLDTTSLVKTLDNVNNKFLAGEVINPEEGINIARWISTRQGKNGSYRDLFAPTEADFKHGIRVFTGERLESASARHIMGQEGARVAWLLGSADPDVRAVYNKATEWMHDAPEFQLSGTYCCGKCTLSFWRHFWVGDFENKEASLVKGLQMMKGRRSADGKWRRFPFFYAIYTLLDLEIEPALDELRYAQPVMERYVKRTRENDFSIRKNSICIKALEKIN